MKPRVVPQNYDSRNAYLKSSSALSSQPWLSVKPLVGGRKVTPRVGPPRLEVEDGMRIIVDHKAGL